MGYSIRGGGYYRYYTNGTEPSDGSWFSIKFTTLTHPCAYGSHPDDDTSEVVFYINDESVVREELPSEITDEVIAKLVDAANEYSPEYDD